MEFSVYYAKDSLVFYISNFWFFAVTFLAYLILRGKKRSNIDYGMIMQIGLNWKTQRKTG